MKFAAFALLMGVNTIHLNRPYERNYFAAGVTDDEVDTMAKTYGEEHFIQIDNRFNATEAEYSDVGHDLTYSPYV